MKEVLVTGANGFLGKIIFNELKSRNNLSCLSRTSGDYKICLKNEIPVFKNSFDMIVHSEGKAHSIPKTDF